MPDNAKRKPDRELENALEETFPASDPIAVGNVTGAEPPKIVSEVMTANPEFIRPQATLQEAARKMKELDVGALPVCDGERLVGIITDRDVTARATSAAQRPDTEVEAIMSRDPL